MSRPTREMRRALAHAEFADALAAGRVTHRDQVKRAFAVLRDEGGFVARMAFSCCRGCAASELHERLKTKGLSDEQIEAHPAVWFTRQDDASFNEHGRLVRDLYLCWNGDAERIAGALVGAGLLVQMPESRSQCFVVPRPSVQVQWNPYARDGAGGFTEARWSRW